MIRLNTLVGAISTLLFASCATESISGTTPEAASPASDSYFVIGIQPHNILLLFEETHIRDGKLERAPMFHLRECGKSKEDYVVVKARPGATYALNGIEVTYGIGGKIYNPRGNMHLSFTVPPGKVLYIEDFDIEVVNLFTGVDIDSHRDIESARNYLKAHNPDLADRLENADLQMLPYR